MPSKSIPISLRITHDDASFLAQLEQDGAATPSEKVRGLIRQARRLQSSRRTYLDALALLRETTAPTRKALDEAERRLDTHSELTHRIIDWLPEIMAGLTTAWTPDGGETALQDLERLERDIADRVFRLIDVVMRMAVTSRCEAYDSNVINDRITPVLELAELIQSQRNG